MSFREIVTWAHAVPFLSSGVLGCYDYPNAAAVLLTVHHAGADLGLCKSRRHRDIILDCWGTGYAVMQPGSLQQIPDGMCAWGRKVPHHLARLAAPLCPTPSSRALHIWTQPAQVERRADRGA